MDDTRAEATGLIGRAWALLGGPRAPRLAVLLAIVLTLPSLGNGMFIDDYFHRARAQGLDLIPRSRLDLFNFCTGKENLRILMELGILPWFASPDLKLAFFRPLTALLHYVDYTVWPTHPALMHAQSIAWYAVVVALVARLCRRLMPPRAAGLAAVLYAVAATHAIPVGWLANRNALRPR